MPTRFSRIISVGPVAAEHAPLAETHHCNHIILFYMQIHTEEKRLCVYVCLVPPECNHLGTPKSFNFSGPFGLQYSSKVAQTFLFPQSVRILGCLILFLITSDSNISHWTFIPDLKLTLCTPCPSSSTSPRSCLYDPEPFISLVNHQHTLVCESSFTKVWGN